MQHSVSFSQIEKKWLSFLFALAIASPFFAQQPSLSVQGVLTKSDGTAVDDGEYSLTFKLWTAPTGGTAVHTETISNVETIGGVYSVVLGVNGTNITASFNQTYYVGVSVGSGSELTPRPRLTHAPYAMALLGTTNSFPGSGTVTADAFKTPGGFPSASAGYACVVGGSTIGGICAPNNVELDIYLQGSERIVLVQPPGAAGYIRIKNKTNFDTDIDVNGVINANGGGTYSVEALNKMRALAYDTYSDRRIKKDFRLSDNPSDLATLRRLRVTDYRHIDETAKGKDSRKGFIAQEVEEIFPEAVSKTADFIPNIYEKSISVSLAADGKLQVVLPKKHELKTGDQIRLIFDGGQKELAVAEILTENTFVVEGWQRPAAPAWVFAYGKKVDDFRQVDYDRIHTLNVSATQELARKVEALEQENAALRAKLDSQSAAIGELVKRMNSIENAGPTGRRK